MNRQTIILILLLLALCCKAVFAQPAKVETKKHGPGQWELLVNGQPYLIKGVVYNPAAIGDDPNVGTLRDWGTLDVNNNGRADFAYETWVDADNDNEQDANEQPIGDWQMMKEMGVNTVRVYQLPSADPRLYGTNYYGGALLTFGHPPNKKIFRDMYKNQGIMLMVGHFFGEWTLGSGAAWDDGTDYRNPVQRKRLLDCVRVMVEEHKDEPYTLMWVLGNENFNPYDQDNAETEVKAFLTLVNEAAQLIHKLDPNHPVAICNWHLDKLKDIARYAPDVDIYGTNHYSSALAEEFEKISKVFDRPVVITEYGKQSLGRSHIDELSVRGYHKLVWRDIEQARYGGKGTGNSIGGCIFAWSDHWHLGGQPNVHDDGAFLGMPYAEWFGITGQGDGSKSPFMRQFKKEYFLYQELWTGKAASQKQHTVTKVLDGDDILLTSGVDVHLLGIDAPDASTPQGAKAKAFVESVVKPGTQVRLEFDQVREDDYEGGRTLAYVFLKGSDPKRGLTPSGVRAGEIMLNAHIVEHGFAKPQPEPPNVKHSKRIEKLYQQAKKAKTGLWTEALNQN